MSGRVLFCPFCGGGTLLLGPDPDVWKCLKCKQEFSVAYRQIFTIREFFPDDPVQGP
jgi:ribosomal protein L37AE/L43A